MKMNQNMRYYFDLSYDLFYDDFEEEQLQSRMINVMKYYLR